MKIKLAALFAAAAVLLSGCGKESSGGSNSRLNSGLITGTASGESEASEPGQGSGDTPSTPDSSDNTSDTSGTSEPVEPDKPEKAELVMRCWQDRKIAFSGKQIEITGKTGKGIEYIVIYYDNDRGRELEGEFEISYDGDRFTAVFSAESLGEGYAAIYVENSGSDNGVISDSYRIKTSPEGFFAIDVRDVAKNNAAVVEAPLEQPLNQVSEYIVKGSEPEEIERILAEIQSISDEVCEGLDSEYEKLRALAGWVAANIYYDHDAADDGISEETLTLDYLLKYKRSVCGGFSNITAALCAAQGIECYNIHGAALTDGRTYAETRDDRLHEWNYAVIDGRGLWVDSCWNSYNHYWGGTYDSSGYSWYYFDLGGDFFALNHMAKYCEHRNYFALVR